MPAEPVPAPLQFAADGTPFSPLYDDVYHSASGGIAQARHVFLAGNDLPRRWQGRSTFVIAETGFGLGLNFLCTWQAWRSDPRRCEVLQFISAEKHPLVGDDLYRAHSAWPGLEREAAELRAHWPGLGGGEHRIALDEGRVVLRLLFGDAVECLSLLDAAVDAFYLDGFSPAKNPELWSLAVFRQLARLSAPAATLATWSVAGHVRRGLQDAGFAVERRSGFAGKRQMLVGWRSARSVDS